jgi:hypothetical protein
MKLLSRRAAHVCADTGASPSRRDLHTPCSSRDTIALPGHGRRRASAGPRICVPPPARRDSGETCTPRAAHPTRPPSPATAGGEPAPRRTCVCRHQRRHQVVYAAARSAAAPPPRGVNHWQPPPSPPPSSGTVRAAGGAGRSVSLSLTASHPRVGVGNVSRPLLRCWSVASESRVPEWGLVAGSPDPTAIHLQIEASSTGEFGAYGTCVPSMAAPII